jgi:glycosyltransferase involved in cell wall biosynthesis
MSDAGFAPEPSSVDEAAPRVSVIVPTFRRPVLARTLQGLAKQDPPFPFELIVVDNDKTPSAQPIVETYAPAVRAPWRYLHEPRSGSSYARNTAIAAAHARVIAWIDDDMEPAPDWLQHLVAPILAGNAEGTGGRVLLDPAVPRPRWFDEAGIGGYVSYFHLADEERELVDREYVITGNAAYLKDWIVRVGGFDPNLGVQGNVNFGGDDVAMARAVRAAGGRMRYVPSAVAIHELPPERLTARYLLRRAWWVGRSNWVLDEQLLRQRRYGAAKVAIDWYATELRRRRAEGFGQSRVLFHALCDTARVGGSLVGAAILARNLHRDKQQLAGTFDR